MFWHKRIFAPGDCIPVEVVNVDAAQKWYAEKLGLNYTSKKIAECNVALGYEENDLLVGIRQVVGGERARRAQPSADSVCEESGCGARISFDAGRGCGAVTKRFRREPVFPVSRFGIK